MARLAKYIWSSAGDSQARVAIVPTSLVTHLAERYGYEDTANNVPNKAVEFLLTAVVSLFPHDANVVPCPRKEDSCSLADSSLVDTVALLSWLCSAVENTDQHMLAAQVMEHT